MKKSLLLLVVLGGLLYFASLYFGGSSYAPPQHISDLKRSDDVKEMGLSLMKLPKQLNVLNDANQGKIVVMVHGYGSQGYEWIHALIQSASKPQTVAFYRWNDQLCQDEAAQELLRTLRVLGQKYQEIVVYAHSYGGIIATLAATQFQEGKLELNIIASPLAGHPKLKNRCGFEGFKNIKETLGHRWVQWKTIKSLDHAFKDLDVDVQAVAIDGMDVVLLPETYKNQRLGHNWSVSYVVDMVDF